MDPDGIDAEEADYLYVAASGLPGAGMGLFAAITLYKDEVIAHYRGERLAPEEAQRREALGEDRYFMMLPDGGVLDPARTKEGMAKYANDADGPSGAGGRNNAVISLDDEGEVCLRALRRIRPGEEILCAYGKRYWKKHG
jgi:SET domain-containing protein